MPRGLGQISGPKNGIGMVDPENGPGQLRSKRQIFMRLHGPWWSWKAAAVLFGRSRAWLCSESCSLCSLGTSSPTCGCYGSGPGQFCKVQKGQILGINISIQVSEVAKLSSSQPAMKTIGDFGVTKSARKTPKNHQRRGNSWEFVVISNGDLPIFGRLA